MAFEGCGDNDCKWCRARREEESKEGKLFKKERPNALSDRNLEDLLQTTLDNLSNFDTKKMAGVDVVFLGHSEYSIQAVVNELRERRESP